MQKTVVRRSYRSIADNILLVMHAFDVKAISVNTVLIDITDLYNSDTELFSLRGAKDDLGIGEMQKDKSYVTGVKTFPSNINFRSVRSYGAGTPPPSGNGQGPVMLERHSTGSPQALPSGSGCQLDFTAANPNAATLLRQKGWILTQKHPRSR